VGNPETAEGSGCYFLHRIKGMAMRANLLHHLQTSSRDLLAEDGYPLFESFANTPCSLGHKMRRMRTICMAKRARAILQSGKMSYPLPECLRPRLESSLARLLKNTKNTVAKSMIAHMINMTEKEYYDFAHFSDKGVPTATKAVIIKAMAGLLDRYAKKRKNPNFFQRDGFVFDNVVFLNSPVLFADSAAKQLQERAIGNWLGYQKNLRGVGEMMENERAEIKKAHWEREIVEWVNLIFPKHATDPPNLAYQFTKMKFVEVDDGVTHIQRTMQELRPTTKTWETDLATKLIPHNCNIHSYYSPLQLSQGIKTPSELKFDVVLFHPHQPGNVALASFCPDVLRELPDNILEFFPRDRSRVYKYNRGSMRLTMVGRSGTLQELGFFVLLKSPGISVYNFYKKR